VKALNRKLLRDLARMPGQGITIALVGALGVASYIATVSTYRSLVYSRDAYYASSRFADVFARVVQAPRTVISRLEAIPGVAHVDGRVTETLRVELEGFDEPVNGIFSTVEPEGLNALYLREGHPIQRDDEVLVNEQHAAAHHLRPGTPITAVINGRRVQLRVAGIALSPEYVWILQPGAFWSDDRRNGVFWMGHRPLATALGFEDAFNDAAIALSPGASLGDVIDSVDRVLEPYGSFGAYGRDRQPSNRLVRQELAQLQSMASLLPAIFLAVAAFLVNVVLSRVVGTQREQIAALKALGYRNGQVARHYVAMALAVMGIGACAGAALGAYVGSAFVSMYTRYFHFPSLEYRLDPWLVATAAGISAASGVLGALSSVRRVVRLAPAEAMRPEVPMSFRKTALDQLAVFRAVPVATRMVVRGLIRQPLRLILSSVGIAMATAIVVAGGASIEAVTHLFDVQFDQAQREDIEIAYPKPLSSRVRRELESLAGVYRVELQRMAPTRIRSGPRSRETVLRAVSERNELRQLLNREESKERIPSGGIVLSRALAELLGTDAGDTVEVEHLAGDRARRTIRITALLDDSLGLSAYMESDALARFLGEPELADGALLGVDPAQLDEVKRRLVALPAIVGLTRPAIAKELFRRQLADVLISYILVLALSAAAIAVGVVYNNARIALATRSRDLATLRILGFRRGEVARVLIGEQVVQVALGIPTGLALGGLLAQAFYASMDPELYRLAVSVSAHTKSLAATVILLATALSAVSIVRGVRNMDLVSVLKARD